METEAVTRFTILAVLMLCNCTRTTRASVDAGVYRYRNTIDLGDIQPIPLEAVGEKFEQLALAGEREVTLRFDSYGGSYVYGERWGRMMEDVKKLHGIKVTCIVDGEAASMAAVLLESPVCDRRLATNRSTILFHNCNVMPKATPEEAKIARTFFPAFDTGMAITVSERLGMKVDEYRKRIDGKDWILSIPEALQLNVIDGVVSPNDIAPPAEG